MLYAKSLRTYFESIILWWAYPPYKVLTWQSYIILQTVQNYNSNICMVAGLHVIF